MGHSDAPSDCWNAKSQIFFGQIISQPKRPKASKMMMTLGWVESFPKHIGKKHVLPLIQNKHPKSLLKIEARNILFKLCAISKKQSSELHKIAPKWGHLEWILFCWIRTWSLCDSFFFKQMIFSYTLCYGDCFCRTRASFEMCLLGEAAEAIMMVLQMVKRCWAEWQLTTCEINEQQLCLHQIGTTFRHQKIYYE